MSAPTRLDKYELLEELGHGGMATVYRGRDPRLGRDVAVKVIHRHLRDEREVKERFYREAKAVAKLRHPGIVEVYDVSEPDDAERYLVVELVRGITLRQLLRDHAPLPTELGLGIGIAVAEALAHAHELGVVHRDVKPENVLLELPELCRSVQNSEVPSAISSQSDLKGKRSIAVKITDFGIAKILDAQGVTSTGEVLGSPAHMAPEQIEGQSVGPKADQFSLGVLIYECIVGHLPFRGNNPAQVLRKVLDGQFVPTARARPEVGTLIGQLIDRSLARDPERRFESVAEFAAALRAELERVHVAEPLLQLTEFVKDPKAFRTSHEQELVSALVARAQAERLRGAVVAAAALYNRALALRPDDAQILAAVARLSRSQKLKSHAVVSGVLAVTVGVGVAIAVYSPLRRHSEPGAVKNGHAPAPSLTLASASAAVPATEAPAAAVPSHGERTGAEPASQVVTRERTTPSRGPTKPVAPPASGKRSVQVVVSGAAGSRLLIDGVERPWFGVKHELEFGVHRFQVIAPNAQCCSVPEPRDVKVGPGEGDLRVVMTVEFRDAQLQLSAGDGTTMTCGELFPGVLTAPGRRSIRVSKPDTRAACTLIPPQESGKRPRTIDVVLRPGGTFTVSGT
jgi:serine/threonine-protein kinase